MSIRVTIDENITIDPQTFQPCMRFYVDVPLELVEDSKNLDGKEKSIDQFIEQLKEEFKKFV